MHDSAWARTTDSGDVMDGSDPWSEFLDRLLATASLADPATVSLAEEQEPFAEADPDGQATSSTMSDSPQSNGKLPDR